MRDIQNSDEYEIVSKEELDELRRDVDKLKENPFGTTKEGENLLEAVRELNNSIKTFTSILEDAQKDIIEEYQNSKPAEKLDIILDQNEKIARALININETMKPSQNHAFKQSIPQQNSQTPFQQSNTVQQPRRMQQFPANNPIQFGQQKQMTGGPLPQMQQASTNLPSLEEVPLPPLDSSTLPPLDNNLPNFAMQNPPKKRGFFG